MWVTYTTHKNPQGEERSSITNSTPVSLENFVEMIENDSL